MSGATALAKAIKEEGITTPVCFVGSHVSALPFDVFKNESCIYLVLCNEDVYELRNFLKKDIDDTERLDQIKGIVILILINKIME